MKFQTWQNTKQIIPNSLAFFWFQHISYSNWKSQFIWMDCSHRSLNILYWYYMHHLLLTSICVTSSHNPLRRRKTKEKYIMSTYTDCYSWWSPTLNLSQLYIYAHIYLKYTDAERNNLVHFCWNRQYLNYF